MDAFSYTGRWAYHVVVVTAGRKPALTGDVATVVGDELTRAAQATEFEIVVFVIMPDHVHVLCEGLTDESNLPRLMQRFKQRPGFDFKRMHGEELWQRSFYEHVLRADEDLLAAAKYILENPVRAELVETIEEWPLSGGTATSGAKAPPLREGLPRP